MSGAILRRGGGWLARLISEKRAQKILASLIEKGVPARFPDVRWGFVEVSAQWLPYVFNDLWDRFRRAGKPFFDDPLAENNMYVACEVTDDLAHVPEQPADLTDLAIQEPRLGRRQNQAGARDRMRSEFLFFGRDRHR